MPSFLPQTQFPATRLRRTRMAEWSRRLVRETRLSADDLVWSLIVQDYAPGSVAIASMPGVERLSPEACAQAALEAVRLGIPALALFPFTPEERKDPQGSEALNPDGAIQKAVRAIKKAAPQIGVMVDVALDPFTDHGHDGLMIDGRIDNDATLACLEAQTASLVEAGADVIAPSDMMDGRIARIRTRLEALGAHDVLILSYAAKYASGFYGPYRDAIGVKKLVGDKRTYQMDCGNIEEALRECAMDVAEGADMLMVKPGLPYLDVLAKVKTAFGLPTLAFQVSGEYAQIKAAAERGWCDEKRVALETLCAFKRAGADGVLTYFARDAARWLQE